MAGYNKTDAAASWGISKKELENRAKAAGYDNTEDYYYSLGGPSYPVIQSITEEVIALDRQLGELGPLTLTDEEREMFLQKAIETVQPYYDRKVAEIEQQISEGKLRTAEDILTNMREIRQETAEQLAYYDLRASETEEEFINKIADITSTSEEDKALKIDDWRQRMRGVQMDQIRSGIFSSGIGAKERRALEERKQLELDTIERRAQSDVTTAETGKKYDLEQIKLARESIKNQRLRALGTPDQEAATEQQALATTGYSDISQLPGTEELTRLRNERGITPITTGGQTALTDLESQRLEDVESRKLELEAQEKGIRTQTYESERDKILAERAKKARQLGTYGVYV